MKGHEDAVDIVSGCACWCREVTCSLLETVFTPVSPTRHGRVHENREFIISNGINHLQRYFETRSSFSAHRSVPYSREPGRTYDVPGH